MVDPPTPWLVLPVICWYTHIFTFPLPSRLRDLREVCDTHHFYICRCLCPNFHFYFIYKVVKLDIQKQPWLSRMWLTNSDIFVFWNVAVKCHCTGMHVAWVHTMVLTSPFLWYFLPCWDVNWGTLYFWKSRFLSFFFFNFFSFLECIIFSLFLLLPSLDFLNKTHFYLKKSLTVRGWFFIYSWL